MGRMVSPMNSQSIEGGCLCGRVRFRVVGELLAFQYCHCSRCRRRSGSAHAANLFTPADGLEWLAGEDAVSTYVLEAEPPFPTAFCSHCGSSLPFESSSGQAWVVPAGALETDPGMRPTRSIFFESRAPWYVEVSDLPKHDGLPG